MSQCWVSLVTRKEYVDLIQLEVFALFKARYFCSASILGWADQRIHMLLCLVQEDIHELLINSGKIVCKTSRFIQLLKSCV